MFEIVPPLASLGHTSIEREALRGKSLAPLCVSLLVDLLNLIKELFERLIPKKARALCGVIPVPCRKLTQEAESADDAKLADERSAPRPVDLMKWT
ncbi:MAG: hypothetical protein GVY18_15600 [Bacteroidetes bacterium]|jgi:hypothetical protein|nr:hypothetical protein [Bacteroidota bacterium]